MPSGAIKDQHGVCALGDATRYLVEVQLHGECVGKWQGERTALAARRTDRAEQVGIFVTLVSGLPWSRPTSRPLPHEPVLLTDPGFVLEPYLDRRSGRQVRQMGAQRAREVFLYASTIPAS